MSSRRSAIRHGAGLGVLMLLALTGGCASTPATPEQAVQQRAVAWLEARSKGDWRRAYDMLAPGYRAVTDFDTWRARAASNAVLAGAEFAEARCQSAQRCTVVVNQQYRPPVPRWQGLMTQSVEQTWLLDGGRWYLLPEL